MAHRLKPKPKFLNGGLVAMTVRMRWKWAKIKDI